MGHYEDFAMPAPNARPRAVGEGTKADTTRKPVEKHDLFNYRLADRICQEELATVYRATHLTLDRPVQVHILRRTDWISVSRFQLAARLAARLNHPNILPVVDAGHDERYGDYLVTPRLETRSLHDVLADGPIAPLLALRIFSQIGLALDHLHEQGIIHRDVQPANILLTPQHTAYLANFSLAAAPDTPDLSSIEEADYLTPYSAPEQSLVSGDPTPALDIYSLGAVLYHMLSGDMPPAPGQEPRSLVERDSTLASVDRVIRRLLAPQPAQRFANAAQAATALRQALRQQIDESTDDMQESHWEPVAEWLENPLEGVMGDVLDHEFVAKSRARADALHRVDAVRRLLERWSRRGVIRRPALGQFIQPEQIVSYDVYLYEMRAHYETRTPAQSREQIHTGGAVGPFDSEVELWTVSVRHVEPFLDVPTEQVVIPGSQRIVPCTECNGATQIGCKTCSSKGSVERTRRVKESDGTTRTESFQENCPTCRGYGKQPCARCEATGQLLQEKFFTWSRHGRIFFNEDDITGLHKLTIQTQAQQVFQGRIDPHESRWHAVAPLKELLDEAIKGGGADSRLIAAELIIRGVPVTEIDYRHRDKAHSLAIIGFDNQIRGDLTLLHVERVALYGVIALLVLTLAIVVFIIR